MYVGLFHKVPHIQVIFLKYVGPHHKLKQTPFDDDITIDISNLLRRTCASICYELRQLNKKQLKTHATVLFVYQYTTYINITKSKHAVIEIV